MESIARYTLHNLVSQHEGRNCLKIRPAEPFYKCVSSPQAFWQLIKGKNS